MPRLKLRQACGGSSKNLREDFKPIKFYYGRKLDYTAERAAEPAERLGNDFEELFCAYQNHA